MVGRKYNGGRGEKQMGKKEKGKRKRRVIEIYINIDAISKREKGEPLLRPNQETPPLKSILKTNGKCPVQLMLAEIKISV